MIRKLISTTLVTTILLFWPDLVLGQSAITPCEATSINFCPDWDWTPASLDALLNRAWGQTSPLKCLGVVESRFAACDDIYSGYVSNLTTWSAPASNPCCQYWRAIDCVLAEIRSKCDQLTDDQLRTVQDRLLDKQRCIEARTEYGAPQCKSSFPFWIFGALGVLVYLAVCGCLAWLFRRSWF